QWDDIAKIFEREAILKGSFDKFAESAKAKRGTPEVDDAFLSEIENWRSDLARNLALRNPKISQCDINFSVQRRIDRIVFLRICEDRRIEVYGRLQALLNGEHTYRRLYQLFREADQRYNSGLFYFQKEKDRVEPPDNLTPELEIDDAVPRKSSGVSIIQTAPTNFPFCQPIFSVRFTSSFSAKSSGSPKAIRPKSKTNQKSRKRAAFITRPPTSSITSSRTRSANFSRTKPRNSGQNSGLSILRAVLARFSSARINIC